jgi:hypothetical protein
MFERLGASSHRLASTFSSGSALSEPTRNAVDDSARREITLRRSEISTGHEIRVSSEYDIQIFRTSVELGIVVHSPRCCSPRRILGTIAGEAFRMLINFSENILLEDLKTQIIDCHPYIVNVRFVTHVRSHTANINFLALTCHALAVGGLEPFDAMRMFRKKTSHLFFDSGKKFRNPLRPHPYCLEVVTSSSGQSRVINRTRARQTYSAYNVLRSSKSSSGWDAPTSSLYAFTNSDPTAFREALMH